MSILSMALLFLISSCSLLQGPKSLEGENKEKLLQKVQLVGEGRGRLTLAQGQYVFNFESLLKENFDWILAVTIPLHGEEVLILPDLRQKQVKRPSVESFEMRITKELKKLKLSQILTTDEFIKEFRSLVRFNLAHKWGQKTICTERKEHLFCELEGEIFHITSAKETLSISKSVGRGATIVLEAKNLTESFFERTDLLLYSNETNLSQKNSSLSLELFWKN